MHKAILLFSIIFCSVPVSVHSQDNEAQVIEEIKNAYDQINYSDAESRALSALEHYDRFQPAQISEIHKYLGLIYFSQNQSEKARTHFESALSLNPELILDPQLVSPKILEFFSQVQKMWQLKRKDEDKTITEFRYLMIEDPRSAAVLRSMVLPGWGQNFKGENTKSRILVAAWSISVAGALVSHIARASARNKYLNETDQAEIDARFNTFNTYHKLRNTLIVVSAATWIYSFFDALITKPTYKNASTNKGKLSIQSSVTPRQARLLLNLNF